MDNKIGKREQELLDKAVSRIVEKEVEKADFSDVVPLQDEIVDANKIHKGKITMMFVDMRDSTHLSERYNEEELVKIYRSYTRVVVQGVRYSGGVVRDFMGDGILAAFVDDEETKSSDKAIRAARYITTAIDKILNPALDKKIKGFRISCGIGVSTGQVMMTKVGMRGRESDDEVENEYGIAWIGNCTNYACKFSGLVSNGAIFIDQGTYDETMAKDESWSYVEKIKGTNIYKGYIAETYYLELEEDREAVTSQNGKNAGKDIYAEFKDIYKYQLSIVSQKSEELGRQAEINKKQALENKDFSQKLSDKEEKLCVRENELKQEKYNFRKSIIASGHCKREYVRAMGRNFWEDRLEELFDAGYAMEKSKYEMQVEVSYAMVSIYEALDLYSEAYDYLVMQVRDYNWISAWVVKEIVQKTGCHWTLVNAIKIRLQDANITESMRKDLKEAKAEIIKLGYWE